LTLPFVAPKRGSSHQIAVCLKARARHGPPFYIPLTCSLPSGLLRRNPMSYLTQRTHKVIALVLALVITASIQGSLLAGFEQMASAEPAPVVVASGE